MKRKHGKVFKCRTSWLCIKDWGIGSPDQIRAVILSSPNFCRLRVELHGGTARSRGKASSGFQEETSGLGWTSATLPCRQSIKFVRHWSSQAPSKLDGQWASSRPLLDLRNQVWDLHGTNHEDFWNKKSKFNGSDQSGYYQARSKL
jgi:hypothetical protein